VLFGLLVAVGLVADQWTKAAMFSWLGMPSIGRAEVAWVVRGVFGFQTSLNEGALFGMGQGRVSIFAGLSILAAIGVVYWLFVAGAARDRFLTFVLGLITAGILGNLIDRLGLPGLRWHVNTPIHNVGEPVYAVRDWILVMFGSYQWPNFNVADSMLVVGASLLLWQAYFPGQEQGTAER
jgi:signal peptidase II